MSRRKTIFRRCWGFSFSSQNGFFEIISPLFILQIADGCPDCTGFDVPRYRLWSGIGIAWGPVLDDSGAIRFTKNKRAIMRTLSQKFCALSRDEDNV